MGGSILEIFAFLTGVLYIVLEVKQSRFMWVVGVVTAIAYIILFAKSSLFAAMGLQLYYAVVSIYGFKSWSKTKNELEGKENAETKETIFYRYPGSKQLILSLLLLIAIFFFLYVILSNLTGDPMPITEAITTSLSIIATWWLSRGYLFQWIIWIAVNLIYVYLFVSQGLWLTALLYLIYAFSAVFGFLYWYYRGVYIKK